MKDSRFSKIKFLQVFIMAFFFVLIVIGVIFFSQPIGISPPTDSSTSFNSISDNSQDRSNVKFNLITADRMDTMLKAEGNEVKSHISPSLKKAIKEANEDALFRVLVNVPGVADYIDQYSEDGFTYKELKNASKDDLSKFGLDGKKLQNKMEQMKLTAILKYNQKETLRCGIKSAVAATMTSELDPISYTFVAELSVEQIYLMANKGYTLYLALPPRPTCYPEVITDSLAIQLEENNNRYKVLITLRIQNVTDGIHYNREFYKDNIQKLPIAECSQANVQSYMDSFVKENQLDPISITCDSISASGGNYASVWASIKCEVSKNKVLDLTKDERVLVISPTTVSQQPTKAECIVP